MHRDQFWDQETSGIEMLQHQRCIADIPATTARACHGPGRHGPAGMTASARGKKEKCFLFLKMLAFHLITKLKCSQQTVSLNNVFSVTFQLST
jgi:hypothetical protein